MSIYDIYDKLSGPLFKRGINRKHRRRKKKRATNLRPYNKFLLSGAV
jgi:hypothetical protein